MYKETFIVSESNGNLNLQYSIEWQMLLKPLHIMTLSDLALKYGSDKAEHGYMDFYQRILPANPISILEIGVKEGASINIWREAYPETKIYGLDLFMEFPQPNIDGVTFFTGSQSDETLLYHIRNDIRPQVIIEDASHNCISHWVSLFSLISCCEMYFIEDLHTCHIDLYQQGLRFEQTVLGSMKAGTFPFRFELFNDKIACVYAA